jgi:hypothetical protein
VFGASPNTGKTHVAFAQYRLFTLGFGRKRQAKKAQGKEEKFGAHSFTVLVLMLCL